MITYHISAYGLIDSSPSSLNKEGHIELIIFFSILNTVSPRDSCSVASLTNLHFKGFRSIVIKAASSLSWIALSFKRMSLMNKKVVLNVCMVLPQML